MLYVFFVLLITLLLNKQFIEGYIYIVNMIGKRLHHFLCNNLIVLLLSFFIITVLLIDFLTVTKFTSEDGYKL